MGLFLIIAGAIAAGLGIAYLVAITFNWLRNKIRQKIAERRTKSVVVADIENLVRKSNNRIPLSELDAMTGGRRAEVIVGLDEYDNIVGDVEIARDTNSTLDAEVEELLGREKIVIVDG